MKALATAPALDLFKWRQFEPEVILLAVGWFCAFHFRIANVEELLAERGLHADHVTCGDGSKRAVRARIAAVLTPPPEAHQ